MKYAYLTKVNTEQGAPMGRSEYNECPGIACQGSILPLAMKEGYDSGGAYWGIPHNVWMARYLCKEFSGRVFIRANSRTEAITKIHLIKGWENVRFKQEIQK